MRSAAVLVEALVVAACSTSSPPSPPPSSPSPPPSSSPPSASASSGPRRWFAGDVHMHVAPMDGGVTLDLAQTAAAARNMKLDFVVLTPHLWTNEWSAAYRREWRELANDARNTTGTTGGALHTYRIEQGPSRCGFIYANL